MMALALTEAAGAAARGEVPVGAVIVGPDGQALTAAGNRGRAMLDPTAHAEILALRAACRRRGALRLPDCTLYVTLEPCAMCAAAAAEARLTRVVFGAYDPKGGAVDSGVCAAARLRHVEVVGGVRARECGALLIEFFRQRRGDGVETRQVARWAS